MIVERRETRPKINHEARASKSPGHGWGTEALGVHYLFQSACISTPWAASVFVLGVNRAVSRPKTRSLAAERIGPGDLFHLLPLEPRACDVSIKSNHRACN